MNKIYKAECGFEETENGWLSRSAAQPGGLSGAYVQGVCGYGGFSGAYVQGVCINGESGGVVRAQCAESRT